MAQLDAQLTDQYVSADTMINVLLDVWAPARAVGPETAARQGGRHPAGRSRHTPHHHDPVIQAQGVTKHFGATTALAGVDLVAEAATVLGLLGPNGLGKTT